MHLHGHNDFGLATAAAVAAVRAGATGSTAPSTGWASGPATPTCSRSRSRSRRSTGLDAARPRPARALAELVQELSGYALEPWKPLVGDNLFRRESGAVASQFHDPPSIEPYSSELVGAERAIVLGKKSGLDSIRIKAEELGLDVPEEASPALLAEVKALGAAKRRSSPTPSSASSPAHHLTDMSRAWDTRPRKVRHDQPKRKRVPEVQYLLGDSELARQASAQLYAECWSRS